MPTLLIAFGRCLARNLLGYGLICLGGLLCLPFVPGPGTPLVLLGLALADWPGKARFFRWLGRFPWYAACATWVRCRCGYQLPGSPRESENQEPTSAKMRVAAPPSPPAAEP